jgi:gamma-glutamyl-gamma-aminobutyrate hydrolase PuuD
VRKIGISLRASNSSSYEELRDGISRDWYKLFMQLNWQHKWVLLPNLGTNTSEYAKYHGIEGIILSSGEDIGVNPVRDKSERDLIGYAIANQLPILGVCRGLQILYAQFGEPMLTTKNNEHIASRHRVNLAGNLPFCHTQGETMEVNSYHCNLLTPPISNIQIMASDDKGFVEGVIDQSKMVAGIMWHPEREKTCSNFDRALFNWLFKH